MNRLPTSYCLLKVRLNFNTERSQISAMRHNGQALSSETVCGTKTLGALEPRRALFAGGSSQDGVLEVNCSLWHLQSIPELLKICSISIGNRYSYKTDLLMQRPTWQTSSFQLRLKFNRSIHCRFTRCIQCYFKNQTIQLSFSRHSLLYTSSYKALVYSLFLGTNNNI